MILQRKRSTLLCYELIIVPQCLHQTKWKEDLTLSKWWLRQG